MVINPGLGGSCGTSLYQLTPPLSPAVLGPLTLTTARQQQLQNLFLTLGSQDGADKLILFIVSKILNDPGDSWSTQGAKLV